MSREWVQTQTTILAFGYNSWTVNDNETQFGHFLEMASWLSEPKFQYDGLTVWRPQTESYEKFRTFYLIIITN